jgi:hypothetical protein
MSVLVITFAATRRKRASRHTLFIVCGHLGMLVEWAGAEDEIGVERKGVDPVRVLRERPDEFALCG